MKEAITALRRMFAIGKSRPSLVTDEDLIDYYEFRKFVRYPGQPTLEEIANYLEHLEQPAPKGEKP